MSAASALEAKVFRLTVFWRRAVAREVAEALAAITLRASFSSPGLALSLAPLQCADVVVVVMVLPPCLFVFALVDRTDALLLHEIDLLFL